MAWKVCHSSVIVAMLCLSHRKLFFVASAHTTFCSSFDFAIARLGQSSQYYLTIALLKTSTTGFYTRHIRLSSTTYLLSELVHCHWLSPSIATGPDKAAYPMLQHFPVSGIDFLLHIFNLFWSLYSFPSIWKTSSIIPICKMGKLLDSPASFRPISLTSCVSQLFECIISSRLLFFLGSNFILSSRQAGFRPGRSTFDQTLFLAQSISDGFNESKPG